MRRRRALRFLECAGGGVLRAVGLRCSVGLGAFRALRLGSIYPQDVGTDREFRVSVGDEETLLECRVSGVPPHFVPARLFARGDSLVWCVGFSSGLLRNVNVCEESRLAALPAAAACRAACLRVRSMRLTDFWSIFGLFASATSFKFLCVAE